MSRPIAQIRRFPPRIMRHTSASWLVQDGVPLYDVQALLGHESIRRRSGTLALRPMRTAGCLNRGKRAGAAVARREGGPLVMTAIVTRNSPLTYKFARWAWEDLNLRPLPYQGSALTV
jgi:hypothetical protein